MAYTVLYYSFSRELMSFDEEDSLWVANLTLSVELSDSTGEIIDTLFKPLKTSVPKGEMVTRSYTVFDYIEPILYPGRYSAKLLLTDLSGGNSDTSIEWISVPDFSGDSLSLSDITLLSEIAEPTGGKFTRYNKDLLPNPSALYGVRLPIMYFYCEIYNLSLEGDSTYTVRYIILDKQRKPVKTLPEEVYRKSSDTGVILGGISIIALPDGDYTLAISVEDNASKRKITSEKQFAVTKRYVSVPSDTILEIMTSQIYYLLSEDEKRGLANLPKDKQPGYINSVWKRLDPDPETDENELRDEIIRRWRYAIDNFSTAEKESLVPNGWRSDRGRVIIEYGFPDEVERHYFEPGEYPWEKWTYYSIQGGVEFIFADLSNVGRMELLSSTAPGEVTNPYWQDAIRKGAVTGQRNIIREE
ncbi:hypothetical protein DRQ19_02480 [bacterium]|nr:MAG: hypothetical protein DRQ19_02480 [bacterium]